MELEEFLRNPPVDNGVDSVCIGGVYAGNYYCYGRGWVYGCGCGAGCGSGKGDVDCSACGSGYGSGRCSGKGYVDCSGR